MDPNIVIGIVSLLLAAMATYFTWAQLRRTPKTLDVPRPPALVPPKRLSPRLEHPFPAVANWVGRNRELELLAPWIENHKGQTICCIEGITGVGKSSLAWMWLQNHVFPRQEELALYAIFQWSFGEDSSSLGECLTSLCNYLNVDVGNQDPITALRNVLDQQRVLLVLDSFERLLRAYSPQAKNLVSMTEADVIFADRECADVLTTRWLRTLATSISARTLLISQLFPRELDGTAVCLRLSLTGFTPQDAITYLLRRGIKGYRAELQAAAEFYGYHPLSLDRLVNVLHYDIVSPDDISRARFYTPAVEKDLHARQQHILKGAFNALPLYLQQFLARLSAVRGQILLAVARLLAGEVPDAMFSLRLRRLEEDHWLTWDRDKNCLDLHPIVRRFAYDHLTNKVGVHEQLRNYFALRAPPDDIQIRSVADCAPLIELYHHTVQAGRFDEGASLFFERLYKPLSLRFGMITTVIGLLSELFPDGEDSQPHLTSEDAQFRALNTLAYAYRLAGKSQRVLALYEAATHLAEKRGAISDIAFGLRNLLRHHILLGNIGTAYEIQDRHAQLARDTADESLLALSHRDLGLLNSLSGDYEGAREEFDEAYRLFAKQDDKRRLGMVWAYRARLAKRQKDTTACLDAASKARELADIEHRERDIIWAEWQLGCAYRIASEFDQAEFHLRSALRLCRSSGMIDLETEILLELARLCLQLRTTEKRRISESKELIDEALMAATRCAYRLAQADAYNILAHIALAQGDVELARREANRAKNTALCGKYVYRPALDEADELLSQIRSS